MGKDVFFTLDPNVPLTPEQIAMIEAARDLPPVEDEENPAIDPVKTPRQYAALLRAVAERNRRITEKLRRMG